VAIQHLVDHRYQAFGVAATDHLVARGDNGAVRLEQRGRAGGSRRIER
jgi:hypothetical protein